MVWAGNRNAVVVGVKEKYIINIMRFNTVIIFFIITNCSLIY